MNHTTFPEIRRSARRLALLSHLTGAAIIAAVTFGTVIAAGSAFGASPRDMANRQVISESCGVRAPFSPSQLDNAFASSRERRETVEASRAPVQPLGHSSEARHLRTG